MLGNDLAGSLVVPNPVVCDKPLQSDPLEACELVPEVVLVCAGSRARELSMQDNEQVCDFPGRKTHGVSEGSTEASAFVDGTNLGLDGLFMGLDSGGLENLPESSFD